MEIASNRQASLLLSNDPTSSDMLASDMQSHGFANLPDSAGDFGVTLQGLFEIPVDFSQSSFTAASPSPNPASPINSPSVEENAQPTTDRWEPLDSTPRGNGAVSNQDATAKAPATDHTAQPDSTPRNGDLTPIRRAIAKEPATIGEQQAHCALKPPEIKEIAQSSSPKSHVTSQPVAQNVSPAISPKGTDPAMMRQISQPKPAATHPMPNSTMKAAPVEKSALPIVRQAADVGAAATERLTPTEAGVRPAQDLPTRAAQSTPQHTRQTDSYVVVASLPTQTKTPVARTTSIQVRAYFNSVRTIDHTSREETQACAAGIPQTAVNPGNVAAQTRPGSVAADKGRLLPITKSCLSNVSPPSIHAGTPAHPAANIRIQKTAQIASTAGEVRKSAGSNVVRSASPRSKQIAPSHAQAPGLSSDNPHTQRTSTITTLNQTPSSLHIPAGAAPQTPSGFAPIRKETPLQAVSRTRGKSLANEPVMSSAPQAHAQSDIRGAASTSTQALTASVASDATDARVEHFARDSSVAVTPAKPRMANATDINGARLSIRIHGESSPSGRLVHASPVRTVSDPIRSSESASLPLAPQPRSIDRNYTDKPGETVLAVSMYDRAQAETHPAAKVSAPLGHATGAVAGAVHDEDGTASHPDPVAKASPVATEKTESFEEIRDGAPPALEIVAQPARPAAKGGPNARANQVANFRSTHESSASVFHAEAPRVSGAQAMVASAADASNDGPRISSSSNQPHLPDVHASSAQPSTRMATSRTFAGPQSNDRSIVTPDEHSITTDARGDALRVGMQALRIQAPSLPALGMQAPPSVSAQPKPPVQQIASRPIQPPVFAPANSASLSSPERPTAPANRHVADVAPTLVVHESFAPHRAPVIVANVSVPIDNSGTAHVTIRQRVGEVDLKIVAPNSASAHSIGRQLESLGRALANDGMRLRNADVTSNERVISGDGSGSNTGGSPYHSGRDNKNNQKIQEVFLFEEANR